MTPEEVQTAGYAFIDALVRALPEHATGPDDPPPPPPPDPEPEPEPDPEPYSGYGIYTLESELDVWTGPREIHATDFTAENMLFPNGIDFYGGGALTLHNCLVRRNGTWLTLMMRNPCALDIEECTLDGNGDATGNGAIHIGASLRSARVSNCDIFGAADGIQIAGDGWLVENTHIHDLTMQGTYPDNTHNDGIQVYNGTGHVFRNNVIDIGAVSPYSNAAIFLQGSEIGDVLIEDNYLNGGAFILRLQNGVVTTRNNELGPDFLWGDVLADGATLIEE